MEPETLLILSARWLHILSATVAVGVPIFIRLAVMPALANMPEQERAALQERIAARWRILVYVSIVLFLATGLYNFLRGGAAWRTFPDALKSRYHMYFGIKFLLAFVVFFLASALAGRSAAFAFIRKKASLWMTILILLGIFVIIISGTMRYMKPAAPQNPPEATNHKSNSTWTVVAICCERPKLRRGQHHAPPLMDQGSVCFFTPLQGVPPIARQVPFFRWHQLLPRTV